MNKSLKVVEDKNMDKSKSLDAALSQIEKQFGKGSIMKLGSDNAIA
ncbi:MAG: DNA recombination/repair protein RecA, partial [Pseudomonadota bacterium]|nr:DNA recombination/repair protein RecA [Pseudomonadota bacterium]